MKTKPSKNWRKYFELKGISWYTYLGVLLCLACYLIGSSLLGGCATTKLPPVVTYEQAKKQVESKGSLVSAPIEEREGFEPGEAKTINKGDQAPFKGVVINKKKALYYKAIQAERDRRRKELQIARKNAAIQKIIYESSIERLRAQAKAQSTWWQRNRGLVGLAFGITIGAGLVIGLLYAVTGGKGVNSSTTNTHILTRPVSHP